MRFDVPSIRHRTFRHTRLDHFVQMLEYFRSGRSGFGVARNCWRHKIRTHKHGMFHGKFRTTNAIFSKEANWRRYCSTATTVTRLWILASRQAFAKTRTHDIGSLSEDARRRSTNTITFLIFCERHLKVGECEFLILYVVQVSASASGVEPALTSMWIEWIL